MLAGFDTFRSRLASGIFTTLIGLCCVAGLPAQQSEHLTLGIHPYLPAKEVRRKFLPLNQYLADQLKIPVRIVISKDYESHIALVGSNTLDIAYMGPASYVAMTRQYGRHPLLARLEVNGSPIFHGDIIVRTDSPVQQLKQLKNKRFAFGSVKSTMSYLVPRRMLRDAGVLLEDLKEYSFLKNHRNVALSVLLGEYDAGAVKEAVYAQYKDKGLRVLAQSPPVSEHLFVASNTMDKIRLKQLRKAMYGLARTQRGLDIVKKVKSTATGLVPVKDSDYDSLRNLLTQP